MYILFRMSDRACKQLISIRVEPRILAWFRTKEPRGYQTLIHSVLTAYVDNQNKTAERKAGRAQELFRRFYAQCFWHYSPTLEITPMNIQLVTDGLRKYGGREGLILAEELCQ